MKNKNPEVDSYMKTLDNPLKEEMEEVRAIILNASNKITEDIKWGAPSFFYKDNICTFNPRAKKFVNLTFHKGFLIAKENDLLEGDAKEARVARFTDMSDIQSKKKALVAVIKRWVDVMDEK